jgi:hypothetical protein
MAESVVPAKSPAIIKEGWLLKRGGFSITTILTILLLLWILAKHSFVFQVNT